MAPYVYALAMAGHSMNFQPGQKYSKNARLNEPFGQEQIVEIKTYSSICTSMDNAHDYTIKLAPTDGMCESVNAVCQRQDVGINFFNGTPTLAGVNELLLKIFILLSHVFFGMVR